MGPMPTSKQCCTQEEVQVSNCGALEETNIPYVNKLPQATNIP